MADAVVTSVPTGATLATAIAYLNSNIASLRTAIVGNIEGRGAAVPNLSANTVDHNTVANGASVNVWSAQAGFAGFVVSGLTYSSASGLTATYTSGSAWVQQTSTDPDRNLLITVSSNVNATLTASSDNYVYLKTDGTLGVATASIGGAAPTLPADTLLLSVATTDGTTVSGTPVDKRVTTSSSVSKHWRSRGFAPVPTSATNIRVPPGTVELEGTLFETTSNNDLDITSSGNFASGSRTSSVWLYTIAANNSGAIKLALTTSAPSATTIVGGATSGSVGYLQFRTIGGLPYRYIGANRLVAGGNLQRGTRFKNVFYLASAPSVLVAGSSTSFTSVAFATYAPPTARLIKVIVGGPTGGAGARIDLRENGGTGTGINVMLSPQNMAGAQVEVPCSSAQKIDYRIATGGTTATIAMYAYEENLD